MCSLSEKLRARQYQDISDSEAELLRRAWQEAPHIFRPTIRSEHPSDSTSLTNSAANPSTKKPSSNPQRISTSRLYPTGGILSAAASQLVKTYCSSTAFGTFDRGNLNLGIQGGNKSHSVFIRIFVAIERIDQNIDIQQLIRRTACFAFANLHHKQKSVDPIVQEIEHGLPGGKNVRTKVYHSLRVGRKWSQILAELASLLQCHPHELTGLLCLLGTPTLWERASIHDQTTALTHLLHKTDIHSKIIEFTPLINIVLQQILLDHSFVDETPKLTTQLAANGLPASSPPDTSSQRIEKTRSPRKAELGTSKLQQPALAALSESVSEPSQVQSEDGKALLVLLSFLAPDNAIHVDNLLLGASPRKRWTAQGSITDIDAVNAGLFPELCSLLSDRGRLTATLGELELSGLSNHGNETYSLEKTVSNSVRKSVPPEYLASWRRQALIVAYRAIPWKYTEPLNPSTQLFLPHLRHTLHETNTFDDSLPQNTQIDLAMTLLEASRLPKLSWKRFAIDEAAFLSKEFANWEVDCRIAQSRAVVARITGQVDSAFACLDATREMTSNANQRSHSVLGQEILQRALNSIQVERLQEAKELLDSWEPLANDPSPLEKVIIFRKALLLGRLLRFQGVFEESITHLKSAHELLDVRDEIAFDEDLRDLFCEIGDTLRELDNPQLAETYLQSEIARRTGNGITAGVASLELSLAEALFAQGRLEAAEVICKNIQDRPTLLKFERLRLHLLFGRLYFETNDLDSLTHWSAALRETGSFHLTNGRTTRVIVLSICDILRRLGHADLVQQSMQQVAFLDEAADPMAINYWIAGMRHWQQHLQSSRSKI